LEAMQRKAQLFESGARKSPTFLRGDAEKKPNFLEAMQRKAQLFESGAKKSPTF